MRKTYTFSVLFAIITFMAFTPVANAVSDLKISNTTIYDISFQSMDVLSTCATNFKSVPSYTIQIIPAAELKKTCHSYCEFQVYSEANCQGKHIGTIGIDINYGVMMVTGGIDDMNVSIGGFDLFFQGMTPTAKRKV